jgi:phosphoribosylaminoimidazolecarboxamide formyltransferase / IMP cyclohydrolase
MPPRAGAIVERQFVEVIIAPGIDEDARRRWRPSATCACWMRPLAGRAVAGLDYKRVGGGLLVQDRDRGSIGAADLRS